MRIALALLISMTVLTACGKKGPLVLPDQATPPAPLAPAPTAAPAAATTK